jgi:hypothetical protein
MSSFQPTKSESPSFEIAGKFGFVLSRDERYGEVLVVFDKLHKQRPNDPKWPYMIGFQLLLVFGSI